MAHSGTVMSIQSFSSDRPSRPEPARPERVDRDIRRPADGTGPPHSPQAPRDNGVSPATAREQDTSVLARPFEPGRPVDRMDLIKQRMAEGFYDRDDVVD